MSPATRELVLAVLDVLLVGVVGAMVLCVVLAFIATRNRR